MPQPGSASSRRILLRSHATPLRRGPGQVQFGLNSEHGVVVEGLTDSEVSWLLSLTLQRSGSRSDLELVSGGSRTAAHLMGLGASQVAELVDLLRRHDLLAVSADGASGNHGGDAQSFDRHRSDVWRVSILGSGRTSENIRAGVAGVEFVEVLDALVPGQRPDAAFLVVNDAVGPSEAASWARSDIRHAPVVLDRHRVVVGPVVDPGRGPCLICLDLRRADRDPAWPLVAAQFDTAPSEWAAPVNANPALNAAATGLCALLARAMSRGERVPPGVTWEVNSPLPHIATRHWLQHPLCPVHSPSVLTDYGHASGPDAEPHAAC